MGSPAFRVDVAPADEQSSLSHGCLTVHLIALSEPDQDRIRQVSAAIDIQAVAYPDPEVFLASDRNTVGCAVCAFRLPKLSGFEFQQRMLVTHPDLPVVFLDRSPKIGDVVRAIRAGASNFLDDSWSQAEMRLAVTEALAESRERRARAIRCAEASTRFAQLDATDAAVLNLLIQGCPNKAVAARLGIGLRTVERRRASALKTLGMSSVLEAVAMKGQLEDDLRLADAFDPTPSEPASLARLRRRIPALR